MITKICTKCQEFKALDQFNKDKSKPDGLRSECKACHKVYRVANADRIKVHRANYRATNVEKIKGAATRPARRYSSYKSCAKNRGISFDLTFDQFMTFWQADCSYCGDPIPMIGLDRVDSSLSYTVDNVVPCCTVCNTMKMAHTFEAWQTHMLKALRHQGVI